MKRKMGAVSVTVIIFVVVLGTVSVMRLTGPGADFFNPVGDVLNGVLSPVEGFFLRLGGGVKDAAEGLFSFGVQQENDALRQKVGELTTDNVRLREQLIAAGGHDVVDESVFPASYWDDMVAARVVGRNENTWYQSVKINKGRRHGIVPEAPVVTRAGLVGKVVSLTETTAQVLLLTDVRGQASAYVRAEGGEAVFGVVSGTYRRGSRLQPWEVLQMDFRQDDEVGAGDVVLTSGLGGVYPRGILVGTVADVTMNPSGLMKTALVTPAVDFDAMEEVFILCGIGDGE
ncbi:MAG: rod shape-determining protein MreC [Peptococcaceae bacterium]|nr:rod shape-determining protein MreC [Peptococcaceae bacterium]